MTPRIKLFQLSLLLILLSAFNFSAPLPLEPVPDSPNVILIIADQMRGDALSVLGHPNVRTPNLDHMAQEGVLFTHYFVNNPVCVPSRMSMFSGKYPHEHGMLSNKAPNDTSIPQRLIASDSTLLGFFHDKGYKLGWFGKDNHTYSRSVLDSLLDDNSSRRRELFRAYSAHTPPHWYSATPWPKEHLYAYKTTTDAIDFIQRNAETPFFTVLSLFDPHPPYFAPADYVAHYPIADIALPVLIAPENLSNRLSMHKKALLYDALTESELKATMAHYYAAIEWGVDYQVGRILNALESMDLKDRTIVLFTSEHGDFMGDYGMVRKGMYLYDALLHVPFIWYGPGRIEQAVVSEQMTQSVDVLPTFIELLGDSLGPSSGISLVPILQGAPEIDPHRSVFASAGYSPLPDTYSFQPEVPYHAPESTSARAFHTRVFNRMTIPQFRTASVRTKNWRLIISETSPIELFNIEATLLERENDATKTEHAKTVDSLTAVLRKTWSWN